MGMLDFSSGNCKERDAKQISIQNIGKLCTRNDILVNEIFAKVWCTNTNFTVRTINNFGDFLKRETSRLKPVKVERNGI